MIKTRAEWDLFKGHTRLEEDLKKTALGKDVFMVKKEILILVNLRKFEKGK